MENTKSYLFSVCAAAILCGIVLKITPPKGSSAVMIKMLCGIFVMITILSPIISLPDCDFQSYFTGLSGEAMSIVAHGKDNAQAEIDAVMQQRLESYIHEKANSLGVDLDVTITVKDGVICSFCACGAISPYKKAQISDYVRDQLGIALEDQQWSTY